MKFRIFTGLLVLIITGLSAQQPDKLLYKVKQPGFYQESILSGIQQYEEKQDKEIPGKYLTVDFTEFDFPTDTSGYDKFWHNSPVSQGATGTCWCYAATSLLESEAYRITGKKVKLSEMYIVYWEYIARARYFVKTRGEMHLGEGSESNAVTRIMKDYGLVPLSAYSGMLEGQKYHNHRQLFNEIKSFLETVKQQNLWNEEFVVTTVKELLNHYLGAPPEKFSWEGKTLTAIEFMNNLKLVPDDYFCFMSTLSIPYNEKGELTEPDNWWHSDDYYNLSLDYFLKTFTTALDEGYTLSICGDVSEPGYDRYEEVGIVPTFDIPREQIDANARELRVYNNSTTDDHCIHVVGYSEEKDGYWFLIKDSSSSAYDGPNKGYRFIREDYVKLKILAVMTHKYAVRDILDKIIK